MKVARWTEAELRRIVTDLESKELFRFEIIEHVSQYYGLTLMRAEHVLRELGLLGPKQARPLRSKAEKGQARPSIFAVMTLAIADDVTLVRIGFSRWPYLRFAEFQDASPIALKMFGVYPHPRAQGMLDDLLGALASETDHGEWLRYTDRVARALERVKQRSDAHAETATTTTKR